ncbi:MAG: hypothetical protein JEY99_12985, partial [Spirochaetales bacterium]|nr:hypothetical protein [Spirochaetales bacterium]
MQPFYLTLGFLIQDGLSVKKQGRPYKKITAAADNENNSLYTVRKYLRFEQIIKNCYRKDSDIEELFASDSSELLFLPRTRL